MELYKLITEDLNWLGMPHWLCIGNWIFGTIILACRISVGVYYYFFVAVNDRIRKAQGDFGGFETNETFYWFSKTFKSCANMRFADALSFFVGVYWIVAFFDLINLYTIGKTYKVYKNQEALFKQKALTAEDIDNAVERDREEIREIFNDQVKSMEGVGFETQQKLLKILQHKNYAEPTQ